MGMFAGARHDAEPSSSQRPCMCRVSGYRITFAHHVCASCLRILCAPCSPTRSVATRTLSAQLQSARRACSRRLMCDSTARPRKRPAGTEGCALSASGGVPRLWPPLPRRRHLSHGQPPGGGAALRGVFGCTRHAHVHGHPCAHLRASRGLARPGTQVPCSPQQAPAPAPRLARCLRSRPPRPPPWRPPRRAWPCCSTCFTPQRSPCRTASSAGECRRGPRPTTRSSTTPATRSPNKVSRRTSCQSVNKVSSVKCQQSVAPHLASRHQHVPPFWPSQCGRLYGPPHRAPPLSRPTAAPTSSGLWCSSTCRWLTARSWPACTAPPRVRAAARRPRHCAAHQPRAVPACLCKQASLPWQASNQALARPCTPASTEWLHTAHLC
jgi:hypothetical protein